MACNTGFHNRCSGCTCTCHATPFDWSGTGEFEDLLDEVDDQEFA